MMVLGILGVVVAVLALGVSMWSVISSRKTANRQNELQQRLLALEISREEDRVRQARSAQVRAAIENAGRDWRLLLMNEGPVAAQNLRVELDGEPLPAHPLVPRGSDEVRRLGSGARAHYLLAPTMGSPTSLVVRITWDDESGDGRSWESQLNL